MTIHIRRDALPSDDCTLILTSHIRDKRLSLEARGVLMWLEIQPPTSEVTEEAIVAAGPDGPDAVRRMLGELELHGYLRRDGATLTLTDPTDGEGRA